MHTMEFEHNFGQHVIMKDVDVEGVVIGVALFDYGRKETLVRYKSADGVIFDKWFPEGLVVPAAKGTV